jgi:FkbM family methyltransferase
MNVIEIGANVGLLTIVAADAVGDRGRVIAYEPAPDTVQTLRRACRSCPHVEIRQAAVADRPGARRFFVDLSASTSSTLYAAAAGPNHRAVLAAVCSLDSELPTLPDAIDFIKIDAQGAEGYIFEGARRLLKRDKPLIIFELWPDGLRAAGVDPGYLLERLAGLGYHFHPVNAKGAVGNDARIAALLVGSLRSSVLNVLAHPRRWPSRRWGALAPPAPCVLPRERRALCRPWGAAPPPSSE